MFGLLVFHGWKQEKEVKYQLYQIKAIFSFGSKIFQFLIYLQQGLGQLKIPCKDFIRVLAIFIFISRPHFKRVYTPLQEGNGTERRIVIKLEKLL
jgi:hypothetical protein